MPDPNEEYRYYYADGVASHIGCMVCLLSAAGVIIAILLVVLI